MSNKICHISTVHSALDARIFYRECKKLVEHGYDVTLIAKNKNKDEIIDGVNIISFPHTNSRLYRVFVLSFFIFYKALSVKADLYHFHDPELMFVGFLLKLFGKKVIYDVHEDLPKQIYNKSYINTKLKPVLSKLIKKIEAYFSAKYDGIVTVVPAIYDRFSKTNKDTVLFRNFPEIRDLDRIKPLEVASDKFIIVYPGSLSKMRGVEDIINVVDLFNGDVELWLLGDWSSENFSDHCQTLDGWKYTKYFGIVKQHEVYAYIKSADIGVHLIHDTPSHRIGYPLKAFDFMACEKTFLISDIGNKRELFNDCALFIKPENIYDIKEKIDLLIKNNDLKQKLAKKGREMVENKYNIEKEILNLIEFYEKILKPEV